MVWLRIEPGIAGTLAITKNTSVGVRYPYSHELEIIIFQVFHVRSVTQGDVIRADAKEIPRIFQVIFSSLFWVVAQLLYLY